MLRQHGVDLLIATPGRLLDLHGRQSLSLDEVEILVLDEADRMVDMGFAPDLRRILSLLPEKRQTLMFSATMPTELNRIAQEALRNPRRIDLAPTARAAEAIDQAFYPVPRHLKLDLLDEILARATDRSAIVFTRTKRGADRVARQLDARGHDVAVIHGDRSQPQRERALVNFRRRRVGILIATDIASRGIDVDDVTHVVNFDVPHTPEDYVHRIGRTGTDERGRRRPDAGGSRGRGRRRGHRALSRSPGRAGEAGRLRLRAARASLTARRANAEGRSHGEPGPKSRRAGGRSEPRRRGSENGPAQVLAFSPTAAAAWTAAPSERAGSTQPEEDVIKVRRANAWRERTGRPSSSDRKSSSGRLRAARKREERFARRSRSQESEAPEVLDSAEVPAEGPAEEESSTEA